MRCGNPRAPQPHSLSSRRPVHVLRFRERWNWTSALSQPLAERVPDRRWMNRSNSELFAKWISRLLIHENKTNMTKLSFWFLIRTGVHFYIQRSLPLWVAFFHLTWIQFSAFGFGDREPPLPRLPPFSEAFSWYQSSPNMLVILSLLYNMAWHQAYQIRLLRGTERILDWKCHPTVRCLFRQPSACANACALHPCHNTLHQYASPPWIFRLFAVSPTNSTNILVNYLSRHALPFFILIVRVSHSLSLYFTRRNFRISHFAIRTWHFEHFRNIVCFPASRHRISQPSIGNPWVLHPVVW